MSLIAFAESIQTLGHARIALHVNGHSMEFNRPEPSDLTESLSAKAEEHLMAAAEILQEKQPGLVVPPALLTAQKGFVIYLMAKCYCVSPEDSSAAGGQVAPLEYFLSIAVRNPYAFDLLDVEFGRAFPAFMEWMLEKFGALIPGNSFGGGKAGETTPEVTPGEAPPPPSEPSPESPSNEAKASKKPRVVAGEN